MKDSQLLRYSRQIVLPEVDIEGQKRILNAKAIVIGLGALGSVCSNYLCRAGLGELVLCDFDKIDISNLHRQTLYEESDIGESKLDVSIRKLRSINSDCSLVGINKRVNIDNLGTLISNGDLVIDATDNFASRHQINQVCQERKAYLVSGAALGWLGQISIFNFELPFSPCYECLFGNSTKEEQSCSDIGVLGPVTGLIGSMQALEVIKKIVDVNVKGSGILRNYDFQKNKMQILQFKIDPDCRTCSSKP